LRTRGSRDGRGAKETHSEAGVAEVAVVRVHTEDEDAVEPRAELVLESELRLEARLLMVLPLMPSLGGSVSRGDSAGPAEAAEGTSGTVTVT